MGAQLSQTVLAICFFFCISCLALYQPYTNSAIYRYDLIRDTYTRESDNKKTPHTYGACAPANNILAKIYHSAHIFVRLAFVWCVAYILMACGSATLALCVVCVVLCCGGGPPGERDAVC